MLSERFDDALLFAAEIHREQRRKGSSVPYIHHLLAVTALVGEHGGSEEQVVAALLHDAIEDCLEHVPDVREQIQARFGDGVLAIVEACTDADVLPKPPWRERKEGYIARLRAKQADDPALLVSLADKVHNAHSILRDYQRIGDELWGRFRGGREGTLWYYRELSDAFGEKGLGPLAREFDRVVTTIHRLAES